MAETARIEIGFEGGQVVAIRLTEDALSELRKRVEGGDGWYDLRSDDGSVAVDLGKVVFVRTLGAPHGIGFSGE